MSSLTPLSLPGRGAGGEGHFTVAQPYILACVIDHLHDGLRRNMKPLTLTLSPVGRGKNP